jgi:hypothetical protein
VSKRLGSPYVSGRSRHWVAAPAVKREAEEDWGQMAMIEADQDVLILKRASASRPSGKWNDDDFDVLADGAMVGRILPHRSARLGCGR